jgi:hypothetical protein
MGKLTRYLWSMIIVPLLQQPKCELTPHEHSMYIRFLWVKPIGAVLRSFSPASFAGRGLKKDATMARQSWSPPQIPYFMCLRAQNLIICVIAIYFWANFMEK